MILILPIANDGFKDTACVLRRLGRQKNSQPKKKSQRLEICCFLTGYHGKKVGVAPNVLPIASM